MLCKYCKKKTKDQISTKYDFLDKIYEIGKENIEKEFSLERVLT